MNETDKAFFENSEELINWTYPGATLYYKDCDLTDKVRSQFTVGKILRNGYMLDVSSRGGGLKFNTRFLIASSKAAKLYEVNPDNTKYGHCCLNIDSYLKVLDVYELNGKTQIFLLHIPAKGVDFFRRTTTNLDTQIIAKAREGFENKIGLEPIPELLEKFWVDRVNFPVGMDGYDRFYPMSEISKLPGVIGETYRGVRSLIKDSSGLNTPEPNFNFIGEEPKRNGFWKSLFGKK
ncbi:MAG: hypothetical protein EOO50_12960 [Flavobacterium sp.]|uniref:hypothetical protein n=1 Tax=Flavobacterium sp. TaxID=239 RepID=UPI00120A1EC1|nr:hypothetical protein [Flavobacterium sp.]RZJ65654.1 MAG: hypothetical protein EOO50_12960 [Flavobacterium sp.]